MRLRGLSKREWRVFNAKFLVGIAILFSVMLALAHVFQK
jgi:hypothetical protein